MMPSSSSSDSDASGDDLPRQAPTAGLMPPSDSEDEEEGEEGVEGKPRKKDKGPSEDAEAAATSGGGAPQLTRKEQKALVADMDRLALVRQRREAERQARIKEEGWDRFAPVSETNRPPAGAPKKRDAEEEEEEEEEESDDE